MCLIAFAWRVHPSYPLVLAANRDEFHHRPAVPAAFWDDAPQLLAGRDQQQGGTWCGVTRSGRFAAVTNYRDPSLPELGKRSRGHLVRDYLLSPRDVATCAAEIESQKQAYSDFNLLLGDREAMYYLGSRHEGPKKLDAGVHGLSNGRLDMAWPKVRHACAGLETLLRDEVVRPDKLFDVLASRHIATDDELPNTGVGLQLERFLSAPFIVSETYGTRASTVILVGSDDGVRFVERRFDSAGTCTGVTDESFSLER